MGFNNLKCFIETADFKSFEKASKRLFIPSPALIKKMNNFEKQINIKLFYRTNRGVELTKAGQSFYNDAKKILQLYNDALQNAKKFQDKSNNICYGISDLNPYFLNGGPITDLAKYFDDNVNIISIKSNYSELIDLLNHLGEDIDFIPHIYGDENLNDVCNSFCLSKVVVKAIIPFDNPLSKKSIIQLNDLNGKDIILMNGKKNKYVNEFNKSIIERTQNIKPHYVDYYDFNTFNFAIQNNMIVLMISNVDLTPNPLMTIKPLEEEYTLPYGICYSLNPSEAVLTHLDMYRKLGISGEYQDAPISGK